MLNRQIAKNDPATYSKPRVDQLAEQTEKQTLCLIRLVDDMLDITRIRSGKLTLRSERFDLCELVRDTVKRMHVQFLEARGAATQSSCVVSPRRANGIE